MEQGTESRERGTVGGSFGPFNPGHAWKLRERLVAWCETADLGYVVGPVDVCEAIIPALDAMLDVDAWLSRVGFSAATAAAGDGGR